MSVPKYDLDRPENPRLIGLRDHWHVIAEWRAMQRRSAFGGQEIDLLALDRKAGQHP